MEKLNMQTTNIVDENIKRIGELFPNCLTERLDENGRPEVAIDFDQLRQELSKDIVEGPEERYQFSWPDKRNAIRLANVPTTDTLRPCREESVDFDNTQNLYIEGDNLQVLKILRENYLGKVKMIYIDPPYNTGNDFVYNDNFDQDKQEYVHNSGQYDEDGNQLVANTESNGRFHTDWLNMIYPRLKVAKDLLSEDGVVLISIGDGECENLGKICDEIFGKANFIAKLTIITGANQAGEGVLIQKNVEYCFVYSKSIAYVKINRVDKTDESLRNLNDAPSPFVTRKDMGYTLYYNPSTNDIIPKFDYDKTLIETDDENLIYKNDYTLIEKGYIPIRPGRRNGKLHRWRWGIDTFKERKKEIVMVSNGDSYIPKFKQAGYNPPKNIHNFIVGTNDLKLLFGDNIPFEYSKGLAFVKYIVSIGADTDSIILDFFSGSATSAHAVMQLNAEDGGKRKFIMVQLPEKTDEKSEAYKAGYKNICEIGKERIRRAGKQILGNMESRCNSLQKTIDMMLSAKPDSTAQMLLLDQLKEIAENIYKEKILPKQKELDELRERMERLDTGFRVLKLDSSNMQDVYYSPEEFNENLLFEDNIKLDRTDEDLLFQAMIELGIELSAKIECLEFSRETLDFSDETTEGKGLTSNASKLKPTIKVWSVADNYLMACFDKDVNETAIKAIAKQHPYYFVLRDASLATDQVADNFEQIWEEYSKETVRRII